jgi:phosphoenolpyruvate carboxykinase (ATP)
MKEHNCNAWLINTGWSGGKYGVGKRMSLKITRRIVDSIHEGALDNAQFTEFPRFKFTIPNEIAGVPTNILNPRNTWANKEDFDKTLNKLADSFVKNFSKYEA